MPFRIVQFDIGAVIRWSIASAICASSMLMVERTPRGGLPLRLNAPILIVRSAILLRDAQRRRRTEGKLGGRTQLRVAYRATSGRTSGWLAHEPTTAGMEAPARRRREPVRERRR